MAKITQHEEFFDKLSGMLNKEAAAGTATGKPGADTHYTSVSKENEHVDKNKEGHPEHNPQEFKQEPAKDKSNPTKKTAEEEAAEATKEAKKKEIVEQALPDTTPAEKAKEEAPGKVEQKLASDNSTNDKLNKLGEELLKAINELKKEGTAGTATGKPGADTHYTSVSKEHEHVDKNKEGHPEHNPQEFKQEPAKDKPNPTKKTAEELDLDKEASFELGRQFARAFLSTKTAEDNVYKEAGRRDFEALIAEAAAELEQEQPQVRPTVQTKQAAVINEDTTNEDTTQVKEAEEAGAQAFYALMKQAQEEEKSNQVKIAFEQKINTILSEKAMAEKRAEELASKVSKYETDMAKQAEEIKLDAKFAEWGGRVVESVISRLKTESVK